VRIGINGLYLIPGGVGGSEIYLRSLVAALGESVSDHKIVLFLANEAARDFPCPPRVRLIAAPVNAIHRAQRLLFEQFQLPHLCDRHEIDVLLNPGFTGPFFPRRPMATVIFDLQFRDHPEYFSAADLLGWRLFVGQTIRRSQRLITISEFTRQRLLNHYPTAQDRVDVVPIGVEDRITSSRWTPEGQGRYLLTISTLHPHKNLDTLLRAYALFARDHPGIPLIVAGLKGNAAESLLALRRELGLDRQVEFTFLIPREHLLDLLLQCWAFVFPSRYEGFGMPVAEALSLGIPTVCSDIPALDEVAGDAALRFPVDSAEALAAALSRVTSDEELRRDLSHRGPEQVRKFHWPTIAKSMIRSLERAAQSSSKT
jgi:glycosyltransferase involved in cell wall biosynthesis